MLTQAGGHRVVLVVMDAGSLRTRSNDARRLRDRAARVLAAETRPGPTRPAFAATLGAQRVPR